LHEQQSLLRQERRAQCGGEIELVQEHSDHLRVVCTIHCYLDAGQGLPSTIFPKPAIVILDKLVRTWLALAKAPLII
jgi:hypothetical protein